MPLPSFLSESMRGLSVGSILRRSESREPPSPGRTIPPPQPPDQTTASGRDAQPRTNTRVVSSVDTKSLGRQTNPSPHVFVTSTNGIRSQSETLAHSTAFASITNQRSQSQTLPQTANQQPQSQTGPIGDFPPPGKRATQAKTDPRKVVSSEKRGTRSQVDPRTISSTIDGQRRVKTELDPRTVSYAVNTRQGAQSETDPPRAISHMANLKPGAQSEVAPRNLPLFTTEVLPVQSETAPRAPFSTRPQSPQHNSHPTTAFPHAPFSPPRPFFYHHSAPTAPPLPSEHAESQISDPEAFLPKSTLRDIWIQCFDEVVYNDLPQYLIRTEDMRLYPRSTLRDLLLRVLRKQPLGLEYARRIKRAYGDKGLRDYCKSEIKRLLKYAIFSHRWGSSEPTFKDMMSGTHSPETTLADSGYSKLRSFCEKARTDYGCEYVWSDTCCINKESSAELEEAIRSMYRWYSDAYICIVYLSQSSSIEDFVDEPWFTRAWTLQELLAPRKLRMYGKNWVPICPKEEDGLGKGFPFPNDKRSQFMIKAISNRSGIDIDSIRDFSSVSRHRSLSEKMVWASERHATRVEDTAYSLLGIFDVTMPIAYGEGEKAFARLLDAIAQRSQDPTFFAWSGNPSQHSSSLPLSPASYKTRIPFHRDALGNGEYNIGKLGVNAKLLVLQVEFLRQPDGAYFLRPKDPTLAQAVTITYRIPRYISDREFMYAVGVVNFRSSKNIGLVEGGSRYFCIFMRDVSKYTHNINLGESTNVFVREQEAATLPILVSNRTYEVPLTDVCLLHRFN